MKKMFVLLLLLLPLSMVAMELITGSFAFQEVEAEGVFSLKEFLSLAVGYFKYVFLTMFMLAANHIVAGTFNWKLWWADSFLPGLIAFGGGLAVAALDIYAANWDFFVEGILGQPTNHADYGNLAVTGMVLFALIKGLFAINKTKEKVALKKAQQ